MRRLPILGFAALLIPACVSRAEHERALQTANDERTRVAAEKQRSDADVARLRDQVKSCEDASQARDTKVSELSTDRHNAQAALDEATAMNQQLRAELERLGKDVDKVLKEKGTLTKALDDAKSRLEELRRAQAAADARTTLFNEMQRRFKRMIDAGFLSIAVRDNRFVMTLPVDQLFDSGRADLRPSGQGPLLEIANTMRTLSKRRFEVAGHADDTKVGSGKFASNWELTAARAVEVVKALVKNGVDPKILAASAYGEFAPLVPNDSAANRAKNRRVEIVLEPGNDELIPVQGAPARAPDGP